MQIFVQTDKHVIDVSKITHVQADLDTCDGATIWFLNGTCVSLPGPEAAQLLEGMDKLAHDRHLVAYRCPPAAEEKPAPSPPPAPVPIENLAPQTPARTRRRRTTAVA